MEAESLKDPPREVTAKVTTGLREYAAGFDFDAFYNGPDTPRPAVPANACTPKEALQRSLSNAEPALTSEAPIVDEALISVVDDIEMVCRCSINESAALTLSLFLVSSMKL